MNDILYIIIILIVLGDDPNLQRPERASLMQID